MNRQFWTSVFGLTVAHIRRTFRDKTALFFTFLFPLLFLFVFGMLYRNNEASFDIALLNHADNSFAKEFVQQIEDNDSFKIKKDTKKLDEAKEKLSQGEIDSIVELPETFGQPNDQNIPSGKLVVYYDEASPQSGQTLAAIFEGMLNRIGQQLMGVQLPFSVESKSNASSDLSAFDYVFAGLIGFTILSLGIFGMANTIPAEKKTGTLRRFRVAPISSLVIIVSYALNYLVSGILSIVVMVVAGVIGFDFQLPTDILSFIVLILFGIVMMLGFGVAIGGWAKDENQSAPLTNLISFPLMFLSGVFFPRFLMPEWLQSFTGYLPLSPLVDGLRAIIAEEKTLFALGPELGIMFVWTILMYFLAIKLFRWE